MQNNFFKIGFFVLLGLIIIVLVYTLSANKNLQEEGTGGHVNVGDTTTTYQKTINDSTAEELRRLTDSVQTVKDSILSVVIFMNDSIDLRTLTRDQRNVQAETLNNLARINLHLDFRLDNARLQLLKTETASLETIIGKYDKAKEKLNALSNRLKKITGIIKTTIDVLGFAVSKGIIVPPTSSKTPLLLSGK